LATDRHEEEQLVEQGMGVARSLFEADSQTKKLAVQIARRSVDDFGLFGR
jgi:hypothetical protein